MDPLLTSLLDLIHALRDRESSLIVGGGFGLFLKRKHLDGRQVPTLFAEKPEPRATNDLDIFLRADLLADVGSTEALVEALRQLGYRSVKSAEFFQWRRAVEVAGVAREVKLDMLVGPLGDHRGKLLVKPPRVRPRGKSVGLHAHQADEALFLEDAPLSIELAGHLSSGAPHVGTACVPEAFPYLLMKLRAFADRKEDANKDLGRHHALDAYAIVAMMTEVEYDRARELAALSRSDPHFIEVRRIVADDFAGPGATGLLRLREHPLFRRDFPVGEFVAVLGEIFAR